MTNFENACVLSLVQPIGFWDQSEWLGCVCVLEIVKEVLSSREETNILCGCGVVLGRSRESG